MAHRGFSLDGAENSTAAFAAAIALGVTYLETDVHSTSDGKLVAFHDAHLDRVTDSSGDVRTMTWDQVRTARIRGIEPIPLFEDLLEQWPQVRWNVDVKSASAIAPLIDLLRRTRCHDRVLIGSFSDRRRTAVLAGAGAAMAWSPGVSRMAAVLSAALAGRARRPSVMVRALGGAACVQVPEHLGPLPILGDRLLDAVHAAGAQVHVWTVDDPDDMARLLDVGVDALITNRADLAMELVRTRRADGHR